MTASRKMSSLLAASLLLSPLVNAHTWVEQYQVIGPNGSYTGNNGYSRGYVARTDPTFNGDGNILWMLPELSAREPNGDVRNRINATDLLCHPNQRTSNYTNPIYPKLKVSPGDYVAMKYYENGHVTLPWNQPGKPSMGGTAFVYATTDPSPSETLSNVLKWTRDGKGGDAKGFLLAAQNYDDGRCHQINNCLISAERQVRFTNHVTGTNTSAELWCETDIRIPVSQKAGGMLTTYWVWQWPTEPGTSCTYPEGKDEYYTTCADFDVVDAHDSAQKQVIGGASSSSTTTTTAGGPPASFALLQQDFQTAAVEGYASRTALTSSPSVTMNDWATFSQQLTAKPSLPASFLSSCSVAGAEAAAMVKAGETPGGPPPSCPAGKWATESAVWASISESVYGGNGAGRTTVVGSSGVGTATATATGRSGVGSVTGSATASATATATATGGITATRTTLATTTTASASGSVTTTVTGKSDGVIKAGAMSSHCATMMKRRHAREFRQREG